jgi:hypothetical protein
MTAQQYNEMQMRQRQQLMNFAAPGLQQMQAQHQAQLAQLMQQTQ